MSNEERVGVFLFRLLYPLPRPVLEVQRNFSDEHERLGFRYSLLRQMVWVIWIRRPVNGMI
jgi:hypothetical protein